MTTQVTWSDEYSVSNESIDGQHKYLFDLCNMIYKLVDQSMNDKSVRQALLGLQDYINIHFEEEELCLQDHPMAEQHRELHKDFISRIDSYIADYKHGSLHLKELADFTRDWLLYHILIIDKQYFRDIDTAS